MRYPNDNFIGGFNKPTIITAQQYETKVSVEIDHSDTNIDELFDAFETICVGLGYHSSTWKEWIIDRAQEYMLEEEEEAFDKDMEHVWTSPELKETVEEYFTENYRATEEDEDEFDDYGKSTTIDKDVVWDWNNTEDTNEWGNETEDDNLFEGDEWEANDNLKAANERYKKEVRKMNAKEKRDNKK